MNNIKFGIGFQINKTELTALQDLLAKISVNAKLPGNELNTSLQQAAATARLVDDALQKAFNQNLGVANIAKFNQELKNNNLTIQKIKSDLTAIGPTGSSAFNLLGTQILKTNVQLKESNKLLDQMAVSMANTVKWGITSSIFNNMTSSMQKAYGYVKNLDKSLNDIRIVTDKSAESMEKFAVQANSAAKELGASTLDYTEASLIYYQQGLSDEEVKARSEVTLKAANVTGQSGEEVSEQLTAVWNGYKVSAEEAELYIDKLAAVAASTAADLEELSTGMSKVASAANSMGVDIDQLNAQLATIVSVTRQAPESVGTALKTIYARMSDLKLGGTDEDGLKLGDVSGTMSEMGIDVLDATGNLREMGDVMEEVAEKWDTWTEAQKTAMAQVMAGKRQYNNLVALFENWDMYNEALETSSEAVGTLQKQQDTYLESTNAKLQKLRTTSQSIYSNLIDTDELNVGIDLLTNFTQVASNFIGSFGGGLKSIAGIAVVIANILHKQIAKGINTALINQQKMAANADVLRQKTELLRQSPNAQKGGNTSLEASYATNYEKQAEWAKQIQTIIKGISTEEYQRLTDLQAQTGELQAQKTLIIETAKEIAKSSNVDINVDRLYSEKDDPKELLNANIGEQQFSEENIILADKNKENAIEQNKEIKNILKTQKDITNEELKSLGVSEKLLHQRKDTKKIDKEIKQELEKIKKTNENIINDNIVKKREEEKNLQTLQKEEKVLRFINETKKQTTEASIKIGENEDEMQNTISAAQQAASVSERVVGITSSLSSVAMTWMSINSLITTWSDETTSFGDKMAQTIMTAGMALPSLISSYNQLTTAIVGSTIASEKENALAAKRNITHTIQNSLTTLSTALTDKQSLAKAKEIALGLVEEGQDIRNIQTETIKNALDAEGIKLDLAQTLALRNLIVAEQGEAAAKTQATAAQHAFNSALLANPITWVVAAVVALTAAVSIYTQHQKAVLEAANKEVEKSKELLKAKEEEKKKIDETVKSYQSLKDQYDKNAISQSEYKNKVLELCDTLDLQSEKIKILSGNYNDLEAAMISAQKAANDKIIQEAQNTQNSANASMSAGFSKGTGLVSDIWKTLGMGLVGGNLDAWKGFSGNTEYFAGGLNVVANANMFTDLQSRLGEDIVQRGAQGGFTITADTDEERYKVYQAIQETLERESQYANTALYKDLQTVAENMKEGAEAYKAAAESKEGATISNLVLSKQSDINKTTNVSDLYEIRKNLIQEANNQGIENASNKIDEQLKNAISNATLYAEMSVMADALEGSQTTAEELDAILKDFSSKEREIFYLEFNKTKSIASAKAAVSATSKYLKTVSADINTDALDKFFGTYAESDKNGMFSDEQFEEMKTIPSLLQGIESAWGSFDEFKKASYADQKATIASIYSDEAQYIAQNGIAGTEQLNKRKTELEKQLELKKKESEIAKKVAEENVFTEEDKKDLINFQDIYKIYSKEEAEAEIQKQNNSIYKDEGAIKELQNYIKLLDKLDKRNTVIKLEIEQDNIVNQINDIENKIEEQEAITLEAVIKLDTSAIMNVDSAVIELTKGFDDLSKAFEVIDKGLKVSAEDVSTIASLFPELLLGAQTYADGSIRLNQEVVRNFTKGQEEQIKAERDRQLASIDAQIKLKESTIKMLYEQLEMAEEVANGTKSYEELAADSEIKLKQWVTDNNIEAYKQVDFAAFTSAENQVEYWSKVAMAAAQAGEAIAAANSGSTIDLKDINVTKGSKIETKTLSDYAYGSDELKGAEAYNAILEQIKQQEKALAALYSQKSTMLSSYNTVLENLAKTAGNVDAALLINYDDEFDRYWELKKAIEEVTHALEDLEEQQDNMHGRELINSLKLENDLLEEQTKRYEALAEEQQKEAIELRALLSNQGFDFYDDGSIANYQEATAKALAAYNAAIQAAGDEDTDEIDNRFEAFKETLERYEELYYDEMKETQDNIKENNKAILENNLEKWETELQIKLDLSQAERDWKEFLHNINKDFTKEFEDISAELNYIFGNSMSYSSETIPADIQAIGDVIKEIQKFQAGESSEMFETISQAQERLKELIETAQSDGEELFDAYESGWDTYLSGIDQAGDKFDRLMGNFDMINEELEYQKQLIELIYGDEAFDLMDTLYKAQEKNTYAEVIALQQQKDMWYSLWKNAEEGSEEQAKYYDLWTSKQSELNTKVTEYIKLLKDDYTNTIENVLKTLETGLTGGSSLADISEEWDRLKEKSDKYYDSVEGLYEIQSLATKIQGSINDTSDIKNQQKLQALYDKEIEYLREKDNLTKYDLDAAEKRYQIALKEIALEEAQNNKNSMKLVRGTDGNWAYQYVADQDDIQSKQQELTDALYEYRELSKTTFEESLEEAQELTENYLEKVREIYLLEGISDKERNEKLKLAQEQYYEDLKLLSQENILARQNLEAANLAVLAGIYQQDSTNFEAMTKTQQDAITQVKELGIKDFSELEDAVAKNYGGMRETASQELATMDGIWNASANNIVNLWNNDENGVRSQVEDAYKKLGEAADTYKLKTEDIGKVIGENFENIGEAANAAAGYVDDLTQSTNKLISETQEKLADYKSKLDLIAKAWDNVKTGLVGSISEAKKYLDVLGRDLDNTLNKQKQVIENSGSYNSGSAGGKEVAKGDSNGYNKENLQWQWIVKEAGIIVKEGTANSESEAQLAARRAKNEEYDLGTPWDALSIEVKKNPAAYDTGGYTGSWGEDGRLALLHQKELVLNAKDTVNILDAVNAVRTLSEVPSSLEEMIVNNLIGLIGKISKLGTSNQTYATSNVITNQSNGDNIFNIHADFSGVNDIVAIKEAILSLPNLASQRLAESKK